MYLRLGSLIDVRAGHDELRVDHLRGPVLFTVFPGIGQARPILVSRPSIMLCEVVDDAVRGGTSTRCGINIPVEYG